MVVAAPSYKDDSQRECQHRSALFAHRRHRRDGLPAVLLGPATGSRKREGFSAFALVAQSHQPLTATSTARWFARTLLVADRQVVQRFVEEPADPRVEILQAVKMQ